MTWMMIDNNSATLKIIAAEDGRLYQIHVNGSIWMYGGGDRHWVKLDENPSSVDIFATRDKLYQRHRDGRIWEYTGPPITGWRELDRNPATRSLAAAPGHLYQRHHNGSVWVYEGTPLTGWRKIMESGTVAIAASHDALVRLTWEGVIERRVHGYDNAWETIGRFTMPRSIAVTPDDAVYCLMRNGEIHRRDGDGWTLLDRNRATTQIAPAPGGALFQKHRDGSIWKFTGTPRSGWQAIDRNTSTAEIVAVSNEVIYQRHSEGAIFRNGYKGALGYSLVLEQVRCIDETEHEGFAFVSGEGLANDAMRLQVVATSNGEGEVPRQDISDLIDLGSDYEDGTVVPINREVARFDVNDRIRFPFMMSTGLILIEEDWFGDMSADLREIIAGFAESAEDVHSAVSEIIGELGSGYWQIGAFIGRIAAEVEPAIARAVLDAANDIFPVSDLILITDGRNRAIPSASVLNIVRFEGHGGEYELRFRWSRFEDEISPPIDLR